MPLPQSLVMTLVAADPSVDLAMVVATRFAGLGTVDWLSPRRACDIRLGAVEVEGMVAAARGMADGARASLADLPVDVFVQPAARRRKRLLVADMESTIIREEMLDELAQMLALGPGVAEITHRAMNGELDFEAAFIERVGLLRGHPASVLDDAALRMSLMPGALALVATMRANGAHAALVSGGFDHFIDQVVEWVGFDEGHGNALEVTDGVLTGRPVRPIRGKDAKRETLERLMAERQIIRLDTLAIGDGANDLAMLEAASLGIAFHAKPSVREVAVNRIDHGDLTAALYAQGYRDKDIVQS